MAKFPESIEACYVLAAEIKLEADAIQQREILLGRDPNKCEEFANIVGRYGQLTGHILRLRKIIS